METELNYGNFAEKKEEQTSKRSEDVVLTAIEKCELLEAELKRAYEIIEQLYEKIEFIEHEGIVR